MRAAGEVEIAWTVYECADQGGAAVDTILGEVFVEFFEMAVAVHSGEHDLAVVEQVGAALEYAVELHLLDEHDPHVGVAGVFLGVVDVDRHQMTVLSVLGDIGAALLANLLDVRSPRVDEVDVLVGELLQQHTVLDAHATRTDHRVLHSPYLLSPVFPWFFKRILTRYRRNTGSAPAWLYALVMNGCNAYKHCL